jgi:hypothetical protein
MSINVRQQMAQKIIQARSKSLKQVPGSKTTQRSPSFEEGSLAGHHGLARNQQILSAA